MAVGLAFAAPAAGGLLTPVGWEPLAGLAGVARGDEVAALALDSATGDLAVGDARGVLVGRSGGAFRRVLRSGPVRDLHFLPASVARGALLVATADGLELVGNDGRAEKLSPGPGPAARDVSRIAAAVGGAAVATADGVFVSLDARIWRPLRSVAAGPALTVALRRDASGELDCWAVVGGELWRSRLAREGPRLLGRGGERVPIPSSGDAAPVDVRFALGGARVAVLFPTTLALLGPGGSPSDGKRDWKVLRPNLPPGARAQRLHEAAGRLWLATDRGLLTADALEGPWRRARPPLGSAPVHAFAGDALAAYVATARGLRAGRVSSPQAEARAVAEFPDDPSIRVVYLAALAYLRLQPWRMDAMREGVERRGWLPLVALRVGTEREDSRSTDRDQSFVSGDTRNLLDRDHDRSTDYEVSLSFSWDLGDVAYHPEEIDVSREARDIIELRDDVLDEIAQLYFERRRVLGELAALEGPAGSDALRLRLRAAELAAGIDAWTGGWFSRHAAQP